MNGMPGLRHPAPAELLPGDSVDFVQAGLSAGNKLDSSLGFKVTLPMSTTHTPESEEAEGGVADPRRTAWPFSSDPHLGVAGNDQPKSQGEDDLEDIEVSHQFKATLPMSTTTSAPTIEQAEGGVADPQWTAWPFSPDLLHLGVADNDQKCHGKFDLEDIGVFHQKVQEPQETQRGIGCEEDFGTQDKDAGTSQKNRQDPQETPRGKEREVNFGTQDKDVGASQKKRQDPQETQWGKGRGERFGTRDKDFGASQKNRQDPQETTRGNEHILDSNLADDLCSPVTAAPGAANVAQSGNYSDVDSNRLYTQPSEFWQVYENLSSVPQARLVVSAAFGNVHGVYAPGTANVRLEPELLRNMQKYIKEKLGCEDPKPVSFVFHGGSGSLPEDIQYAIKSGVVQMNSEGDISAFENSWHGFQAKVLGLSV